MNLCTRFSPSSLLLGPTGSCGEKGSLAGGTGPVLRKGLAPELGARPGLKLAVNQSCLAGEASDPPLSLLFLL